MGCSTRLMIITFFVMPGFLACFNYGKGYKCENRAIRTGNQTRSPSPNGACFLYRPELAQSRINIQKRSYKFSENMFWFSRDFCWQGACWRWIKLAFFLKHFHWFQHCIIQLAHARTRKACYSTQYTRKADRQGSLAHATRRVLYKQRFSLFLEDLMKPKGETFRKLRG